MARAFFVTGTDTEVGKTAISCALLHAAAGQGLRTAAVKPVAAGDRIEAEVEPLSEGRTIAAYRIIVRRSDGVTVASFTGTTVRLSD